MSDEEKVEATATEEQQETGGEAEAQASAGTENTEEAQAAAQGHMIPKSRFDEVIGERNTLREENQTLHDRLEALESKSKGAGQEQETEASEEDGPPEHLSAREKVDWYVRRGIEKELGMGVDDIKSLLRSVKPTSEDYAQRQWQNLCQRYSLDPANKDLGEYFYNFVKAQGEKANYDKIMQKAAPLFGGKIPEKGNGKQAVTTPSASVEEPGVTGTMSEGRMTFRNAKEATDAAVKGQLAAYESIDEIFERTKAEAAKAGK